LFDAKLELLSINLTSPDEDQINDGATPEVVTILTEAMALPIPDPSDPERPLLIPVGHYRFSLDGDTALAIGQQYIELGEKLPKRSRVIVSRNLSAAEQAAERLAALKGGPRG
jgi:hypothetical protein